MPCAICGAWIYWPSGGAWRDISNYKCKDLMHGALKKSVCFDGQYFVAVCTTCLGQRRDIFRRRYDDPKPLRLRSRSPGQ